jgi:hypothetical protein
MTTRRLIPLAGLILAMCLPAPAAFADDGSVYSAWISRDAKFDATGKRFREGLKIWKQSDYKRDRKALRAIRAATKLLGEVDRLISAEDASSEHGRLARTAVLRSVRRLRGSTRELGVSIAALTDRRIRVARRHQRRARKLLNQANAAEKTAKREFRAAGITVPPDAGP